MVKIAHGNLLTAPVEALVNTVNTEGVMGKGIALQFKQAYPEMYKSYEKACKAGEVRLGQMSVYDLGGLVGGARWIINFPTKGHWRAKSRLGDIADGLEDLVHRIKSLGISSIAVPPLGCGHGGLDWKKVRPLIEAAFACVPEVEVLLYEPAGAPDAKEMPNRTAAPEMTVGRATLISLIDRYISGLLDPYVSLLEVHKLMYFMQEAGQPLRLQFKALHYGPYATNLRQVLIKLEGHYLRGYGAGEDTPTKHIELEPGAVEEAKAFLAADHEAQERMGRVAALIEGFEDPYGMEVLSSVHWVMCHHTGAREDADIAVEAVHNWNRRKRGLLEPHHLRKAWERLVEYQWHNESRSALH